MQKINNAKIKKHKLKDTTYLCGVLPQACSLPTARSLLGDDFEEGILFIFIYIYFLFHPCLYSTVLEQ
jgi:hypothetical protein